MPEPIIELTTISIAVNNPSRVSKPLECTSECASFSFFKGNICFSEKSA